jgi:glycosyltransferase involved in cell wall biosynthesis
MRILICNWRDPAHPRAGGAEVYTHEVARRWVAAGHKVVWFAAAVDNRPEREELDGISLVRAGTRLSVYREARRFYESVGTAAFDLIIDEVNTRPFMCHLWPGRAPVVALIHQVAREAWFTEMPLPVALAGRYFFEPIWLHQMRHVPTMTVSESSRDSLLGYGMQRVVVVSEGIDECPSFRPRPKEPQLTLIFVGRQSKNKRPDHALAVHEIVRGRIPNAQLWVVGTGPMEERLRRQNRPGVTFFGRLSTDDRNDRVGRAHALLVTSTREGWGLVVDEAAAAGTPAFGYNVGGLSDSIPAAGGILTEDCPEDLARTVCLAAHTLTSIESLDPWRGAARNWDDVATEVFNTATAIAQPFGSAVLPPRPKQLQVQHVSS